MEELRRLLSCTTLQMLVQGKESLVEVHYTATVEETLEVMRERNIDAVLVASPDGNSLDDKNCFMENGPVQAGRTQRVVIDGTILDDESIQNYYTGMVTTLNILTYFAQRLRASDNGKSSTSSILESPIHLCIEEKTIYMMSPCTSVLKAMERMLDDVHVALIPHRTNRKDLELTCYSLFTPMDIIQFFQNEAEKFEPILSQRVKSLNVVHMGLQGVWEGMSLLNTIKCMHRASISILPIVELTQEDFEQSDQLLDAKGTAILGTFSASHLRGCPSEFLRRWAMEGVLAFLKKVVVMRKASCSINTLEADPDGMYEVELLGSFLQFDHCSCLLDNTIGDVINTALQDSVHKVWIVEKDCVLIGAISLTDIFRVVKNCVDT